MKKISLLVMLFTLSACQSTNQSKVEAVTSIELLPDIIEYSPSFLFRYKDILNIEQKRILWDVVNQDFQALKDKKTHAFEERGASIKEHQEFSFMGSIYSSLRTPDYISGIITFEGDELYESPKKFKLFTASIYDKRITPAFNTLARDFNVNYHCVYGCENNKANKIYEFSGLNMTGKEDLPNKVYASVCISKQKSINRLNSKFYDVSKDRKALYTNAYDGFNVMFYVLEDETNVDFSIADNLSTSTKYNRHCKKPDNSIDAFNFTFGRDFYRSISKSIPEYFATLNFDNEYALYEGDIWKLSNKDDAKLFHGIKTIN